MSLCHEYLTAYKQQCKVVYSDIKCEIQNIDTMSIIDLNLHLKQMQRLYNKSKKCYEFRVLYQSQCVQGNIDKGHDHAIRKAFKYFNQCENQLKRIRKRMDELKRIINQSYNLLADLEENMDGTRDWQVVVH
jgi:hypothetical protein